MLKKLIKIKKDQSDNESGAVDIDQFDNEIEIEKEVNKIESSSSEDDCAKCNRNVWVKCVSKTEFICKRLSFQEIQEFNSDTKGDMFNYYLLIFKIIFKR